MAVFLDVNPYLRYCILPSGGVGAPATAFVCVSTALLSLSLPNVRLFPRWEVNLSPSHHRRCRRVIPHCPSVTISFYAAPR